MTTDDTLELTINNGTILLVAEILQSERGHTELPINDAGQAIVDAVKRLAPTKNTAKEG